MEFHTSLVVMPHILALRFITVSSTFSSDIYKAKKRRVLFFVIQITGNSKNFMKRDPRKTQIYDSKILKNLLYLLNSSSYGSCLFLLCCFQIQLHNGCKTFERHHFTLIHFPCYQVHHRHTH